MISFTSCRAGPGGAAKSCDALLTRVEQNDATLQELVILSNKTFGATEVERLAAALGKLSFFWLYRRAMNDMIMSKETYTTTTL